MSYRDGIFPNGNPAGVEGVDFVLGEDGVVSAYTNLPITSPSLTDGGVGGAASVPGSAVQGGRGGRGAAGQVGLVDTASRFHRGISACSFGDDSPISDSILDVAGAELGNGGSTHSPVIVAQTPPMLERLFVDWPVTVSPTKET